MKNINKNLDQLIVDSLYGKKKHFNAANRISNYNLYIGLPLIFLNCLTGSLLFMTLSDSTNGSWKLISMIISFVAAFLSTIQTFFNFSRKMEGHLRIGNKYLEVYKDGQFLKSKYKDKLLTNEQFIDHLDQLIKKISQINQEAESFPTKKIDYETAKKGIDSGEEKYLKSELEVYYESID